MPIKLNLDRIMSDREISLTELADRIGITLANLSILKTSEARDPLFNAQCDLRDTLVPAWRHSAV